MGKEFAGILIVYVLGAIGALVEGIREAVIKGNPFGIVRRYFFLGIFVWGDAIVLGLFWLGVVTWSIITGDEKMFLLTATMFWTVRSMGEVQYWLNQQFSGKERNKPKDLWGSKWFGGDSIWFVYQIFWQCMTVIFAVWTIYLITKL